MSAKPIKKSSIYTKTGDQGTSSLFSGERKSKSDAIFDALGAGDELSAHLGLAREFCDQAQNYSLCEKLEEIQSRLIDLMANVATPRSCDSEDKIKRTEFDEQNITTLEGWIDEIDSELPTLTQFILPSGGLASSQLHICRSVCRRMERNMVACNDPKLDSSVIIYANRLSDFLFVAARNSCYHENKTETTYKKK